MGAECQGENEWRGPRPGLESMSLSPPSLPLPFLPALYFLTVSSSLSILSSMSRHCPRFASIVPQRAGRPKGSSPAYVPSTTSLFFPFSSLSHIFFQSSLPLFPAEGKGKRTLKERETCDLVARLARWLCALGPQILEPRNAGGRKRERGGTWLCGASGSSGGWLAELNKMKRAAQRMQIEEGGK